MARLAYGISAWIGLTVVLFQIAGQTWRTATVGAVLMCGALLGFQIYSRLSGGKLDFAVGVKAGRKLGEKRVLTELVECLDLLARVDRGETVRLIIPYMKWRYEQQKFVGAAPPLNDSAEIVLHFANRLFKEALLADPGMVSVRLLYVGFLLSRVRNYVLAWEVNQGTISGHAGILQRFHVFRYRYKRLQYPHS